MVDYVVSHLFRLFKNLTSYFTTCPKQSVQTFYAKEPTLNASYYSQYAKKFAQLSSPTSTWYQFSST